eukprot:COSAG06_NODE_1317_length_9885_cov_44.166820_12_plen_50_part_00
MRKPAFPPGPSRWQADVKTGMMPDIAFNFSASSTTEFARVDALNWHIYA